MKLLRQLMKKYEDGLGLAVDMQDYTVGTIVHWRNNCTPTNTYLTIGGTTSAAYDLNLTTLTFTRNTRLVNIVMVCIIINTGVINDARTRYMKLCSQQYAVYVII